MTALDDACRALVEQFENEGAAACGVVDLDSGIILGAHCAAPFDQALQDLVALTAVEFFRGPNVTRIEQLVRAQVGAAPSNEQGVRELYLASGQTAHFARAICDGRAVLLLVTARLTNLGLGWAKLRASIPQVEQLVP